MRTLLLISLIIGGETIDIEPLSIGISDSSNVTNELQFHIDSWTVVAASTHSVIDFPQNLFAIKQQKISFVARTIETKIENDTFKLLYLDITCVTSLFDINGTFIRYEIQKDLYVCDKTYPITFGADTYFRVKKDKFWFLFGFFEKENLFDYIFFIDYQFKNYSDALITYQEFYQKFVKSHNKKIESITAFQHKLYDRSKRSYCNNVNEETPCTEIFKVIQQIERKDFMLQIVESVVVLTILLILITIGLILYFGVC